MATATSKPAVPYRRRRFTRRRVLGGFWSFVTWIIAIFLFFPVFWMVLTSFKTEGDAYTNPPRFIFIRASPSTRRSSTAASAIRCCTRSS